MAYYIVLPFFTILLIVLQRTLLDLLFGGRIGVEMSLILSFLCSVGSCVQKGTGLISRRAAARTN